MERLFCDTHSIEILIYSKDDEKLFRDDNRQEVAIFFDDNGRKYLKRFLPNQCNENCETIKQILKED